MGIFQKKPRSVKKSPIDESADGVQRFFEGYFRELRERGRISFEKTASEHTAKFKGDLDATITKANADLKRHITVQLDAQIVENGKAIQAAQAQAVEAMGQSAKEVQTQHQQLVATLEKSIAEQATQMKGAFEANKTQLAAMQAVQTEAVEALSRSAQAVEAEYQQLSETLHKNMITQEAMLIHTFEDNMAQIIEHYVVGALGDSFDLKAQLPAIIKQMEQNKQAIVDDMKL